MGSQSLNGLESFLFPSVKNKNSVESGAITYGKDIETGEIINQSEGDIPISIMPPLDWDNDFPITNDEDDEKEKSELEDLQIRALKIEYGSALETTSTQSLGIRFNENEVAVNKNNIEYSNKVKEKYVDAEGKENTIYQGYKRNADIKTKRELEQGMQKRAENDVDVAMSEIDLINSEVTEQDIEEDPLKNFDYQGLTDKDIFYIEALNPLRQMAGLEPIPINQQYIDDINNAAIMTPKLQAFLKKDKKSVESDNEEV